MSPEAGPPETNLSSAWLFTIEVLIGPERHVGRSEAGERIDFPIVGGSFAGPEISGDVVPGGADHFLMRPDGIGVLDARYQLRAADGSLIDIHNRGLWVPNAAGLAKVRAGGEPAAEELYCRCTPQFTAPAGAHDWLNRIVATGRVDYPRPGLVVVTCFRIL